MKKRWIILSVVLLVIALWCYCLRPREYELRQPIDAISTITILDGTNYDVDTQMYPLVAELQVSEGKKLINQVLELKCERALLDPPGDFGAYIIEIVYLDGEIEMLGPNNCGWIQENGKLRFNNMTFGKTFVILVSKWAQRDGSIVP